jgi:glucosamine kinase
MGARLYCCVDGGASNTRVALYDDAGRRLGLTVAGPTSLTVRGTDAWNEILGALQNLSQAISLEGEYLSRTHFGIGLAGANNTAQRQRFIAAAPSVGALRVSTDAYITALAAHGGAPGAVIIIGTGSVGYRVEAAGRCRLVGGWGFPVGDEGSGAWIGRVAMGQAVKVHDTRYRGRITGMHRSIIEQCGRTRDELLDWLLGASPARYAEIAPLVVDCAGRGDSAALEIVNTAGREIDTLAEALDPGRHIPMALVGGLAEPLLPFLPETLRGWIREPSEEPLGGALMLARGRAPDETIVWSGR